MGSEGGESVTTSATFDVTAVAPSSGSCGGVGCVVNDAAWSGDVLTGQARYPDYAVVAVSGGGLGSSVSDLGYFRPDFRVTVRRTLLLCDDYEVVWSPSSAADLISAIQGRWLPYESAAFEVKKQLPAPNKNSDIAIDVAAMATDGGVIIYGVLEDKENVTFSATPIALAGVKDRISNIVAAYVREDVFFDVRLLELETDPTSGFVVIDVPASIRAPHMVESKGEYRFYGRVPGGNQLLSEAQVARLYERRERVERESGKALDDWVAARPGGQVPGRVDLYLVVKPLLSDVEFRERSLKGNDRQLVGNAIHYAVMSLRFKESGGKYVARIVDTAHGHTTADGYMVTTPPVMIGGEESTEFDVALEVLDDGTCRYFQSSMNWHRSVDNGEHVVLNDAGVAQCAAQVAHVAGLLFNHGVYHGQVDVSLLVTNVKDAVSSHWFTQPGAYFLPNSLPSFPKEEHRATLRVTANQLQTEPCEIARRLTSRMLRVIRPSGQPDPLFLV